MTPNLAWAGCGALALKDRVGVIADLPGGIYERQIGDLWRIVFNGGAKTREQDDHAPKLPPFSVYVEFNGWPAGIIGPSGGILAAGDAANEDTFIAAIEAELGQPIEAALAARRASAREGEGQ